MAEYEINIHVSKERTGCSMIVITRQSAHDSLHTTHNNDRDRINHGLSNSVVKQSENFAKN